MIYFIRHGQTDYNKQRKIQGRIDINLNSEGITQAKNLKDKLKNINFDVVYCSPLLRAKQTLKEISTLNPIIDDRLIERNFGELEGKNFSLIENKEVWSLNNDSYKNLESMESLFERVDSFLNELKTIKNKNVLIVSHGGVSVAIKNYLFGKPSNDNYFSYVIKNGEILSFSL